MSKKYVYLFKEGNADMRELLGGKGANLAEMTNLGLPIPQGFTVTTEACTEYYNDGKRINEEINELFLKLNENSVFDKRSYGSSNITISSFDIKYSYVYKINFQNLPPL